MNLFFLDAGGAYLAQVIALIFLALCTILEAVTLIIMKFNHAGKCFLDALLVNLASLVAGYLMLRYAMDNAEIREGNEGLQDLGIMFVVTMIIEGLLMMLLNRAKPAKKIWIATLVMNLVSYLLLVIIIYN